jgi:Protein of unknown function (DUF2950)
MRQSKSVYRLFMIMAFTGFVTVLPGQPKEAHNNPVVTPRLFASPDEAVKTLQAATGAKDKAALREIFGSEVKELLTGDSAQDAKNAQRFAASMAQSYTLVKDGEDRVTVEVGPNNWPMPIPLIRANGQWYFNTAEGKEEIINRHIGKDELHAIGVCRAYVKAQEQFAAMNPDGGHRTKYARKFKSTPGKTDGLYWPQADTKEASPLGPVVAEADFEDYAASKGARPQPFHGYYFKILTQQGTAAPGGRMNYMDHGNLTLGFALVAYPAHWDKSGVMTFIVNQKAQVFERNLGGKTFRIAEAMKEYNPDSQWTVVSDTGLVSAVSGK